MSGLEIAGVVLGSLPLIISALEHYANGINTTKRYWRYKSEIRSLILQVKTERGIFLNTIEQLLNGIVRIEQMETFLSSPRGDIWRDDDVNSKLKDRLRGAYEVYRDNVEGMKTSLQAIMEKLALDPDTGKVRLESEEHYANGSNTYLSLNSSTQDSLNKSTNVSNSASAKSSMPNIWAISRISTRL